VEAVHNAGRHGRATRCEVRLLRERDLTVEVTDDGQGLPATFRPGGGFLSMRDRAEAIGGRWSIGPVPTGGTRVQAVLPIEP
jgi:signal transduction histidine kinase